MTATGKLGILNPLAIIFENHLARLGMVIIGIFTLAALFAPWLAPHDPIAQNLGQRLQPPSWTYPLGTDDLGRCVLSRMIHATRISLRIGLLVVSITAISGSIIGLFSGYTGGITDELIMRATDVFLAFPGIVLALVVAGVLGPGLTNTMLALALIGWTGYARLVRGCVLSTREKTFVEATQVLGAGHVYIMFRHILPEVLGPVLVMATLGMGWTILSSAALSFLGLGAQPPVPEWGAMLSSGRPYLRTAWHLSTFPGLAIMVVVLAFNFLGDGLNDALNHKKKPADGN
jgi:peptide/nickel transport system permease protein